MHQSLHVTDAFRARDPAGLSRQVAVSRFLNLIYHIYHTKVQAFYLLKARNLFL